MSEIILLALVFLAGFFLVHTAALPQAPINLNATFIKSSNLNANEASRR